MTNRSYDNLVKDLVEQIIASNKPFNEIDKKVIHSYLDQTKVPRHIQESIIKAIGYEYARIMNERNSKNKTSRSSDVKVSKSPDVEIKASHKTRTPRKTVFTEIKRVC